MPFIDIRTNQRTTTDEGADLLSDLSQSVNAIKGDRMEMISCALHQDLPVAFDADAETPAAIVQMTATGFDEDLTAHLTRAFSSTLGERLGIDAKRIYIFFREVTRADRFLVGWSGKTFKELIPGEDQEGGS